MSFLIEDQSWAGEIKHGIICRRAAAAFWLDTKRFDLPWI
jgi:hypothetical protein